MKRHPSEWEKIIANDATDKELISKIYKHIINTSYTHLYVLKLYSGLPRWLSGKESTCQARDVGLIPGSERSPGERHGNTPVFVFL